MKLASIRLVTNDVPALASFYESVTGIAPTVPFGSAADYVELEVDSVAEVDAVRARIAGRVTDWIQEPTDQPWGNRSMLFRDPDGTAINVYAVRARG